MEDGGTHPPPPLFPPLPAAPLPTAHSTVDLGSRYADHVKNSVESVHLP